MNDCIDLGIIDMDDVPSEKETSKLPTATKNLALSADQEKGEIFEAGINIGRVEAFDFMATVANSSIIVTYENVKKTKAWKYLRNGDGRHFQSLEEFCEVKLGKSYRRMRELSANRKLIGEAAFEQAEKIGLRQSDFRAIKALPPNQQEIIRKGLEDGADLETVKSALHSLSKEYQFETGMLNEKIENIQKRINEQDALLEKRDAEIAKLTSEQRLTKWHPQTERVRVECQELKAEAELGLNSLYKLFEDVAENDNALPEQDFRINRILVTVQTLNAVMADINRKIESVIPKEHWPNGIGAENFMSEAEALKWQRDYALIENRHNAKKAARELTLDDVKPRGRGRPRKIAQ